LLEGKHWKRSGVIGVSVSRRRSICGDVFGDDGDGRIDGDWEKIPCVLRWDVSILIGMLQLMSSKILSMSGKGRSENVPKRTCGLSGISGDSVFVIEPP
jgi:hypothetical protein